MMTTNDNDDDGNGNSNVDDYDDDKDNDDDDNMIRTATFITVINFYRVFTRLHLHPACRISLHFLAE